MEGLKTNICGVYKIISPSNKVYIGHSTNIGSENYAATVVEIKQVFDIPGADFIKRVNIFGSDVITSSGVKPGDVLLFFCSGTCINEEYCKFNNLYSDKELNRDNTVSGYLSKTGRTKAIKLRGVISDGLLMPISSLVNFYNRIETIAKTDTNELISFNFGKNIEESMFKVGDTFTTINGFKLCEKYIVPSARNSGTGVPKVKEKFRLTDIMIPGQFKFHKDTAHLARSISRLQEEDLYVITAKFHGSSIIISRVLGVRKLSLKDKIAKFFGAKVAETEFVDIWSSGKPKSNLPKGISSGWTSSNPSYYKEDVWKIAYNDHKDTLEKGITLYGKIIGNHIQGGFDYTKLLIPEKNYGLYIYRITQTNEDGITYEFTWDQIKAYCNKYELKHVPEIEYGFKSQLTFNIEEPDGAYFEDQCKYCLNKVPNEGICVRNDKTFEVFKHKNPLFLLKEDKNLEEGITNIEDNQDE